MSFNLPAPEYKVFVMSVCAHVNILLQITDEFIGGAWVSFMLCFANSQEHLLCPTCEKGQYEQCPDPILPTLSIYV